MDVKTFEKTSEEGSRWGFQVVDVVHVTDHCNVWFGDEVLVLFESNPTYYSKSAAQEAGVNRVRQIYAKWRELMPYLFTK